MAHSKEPFKHFLDTIVNENMSSPSIAHSLPPEDDEIMSSSPLEHLLSSPTADFSPQAVAQATEDRWRATIVKAKVLKQRLKREKSSINALKEQYHAGQSSDKALHNLIMTAERWLQSILQNFNSAIRDHTASQHVTEVKLLRAGIRTIEQKQLAVEIALKQAPYREAGNGEQYLVEEQSEQEAGEGLPVDRLFKMEDACLELTELEFPFTKQDEL